MNILFLGIPESPLIPFLEQDGHRVSVRGDRVEPTNLGEPLPDFLISHGFRYLIPPKVLELFPRRAVNLHISFLPWNRGADPNLWSFLEDTPKGVSIHYLTPRLDAGDLIAQKSVTFDDPRETLKTSYATLQDTIISLFISYWPSIRNGSCESWPQPPGGSFHRLADKEPYLHLLSQGWDTPVIRLIGRTFAL